MSTVVTLNCVNLNKTAGGSRDTVYPRSSLDTLQQIGSIANYFFVSFDSLSSAYNFKKIIDAKYYMTGRPGADSYGIYAAYMLDVAAIGTSWNPQTITYNNEPSISTTFSGGIYIDSENTDHTYYIGIPCYNASTLSNFKNVLSYGVRLHLNSRYSRADMGYFYAKGNNSPYLRLEFDSTNANISPSSLSPQSGYIPKQSSNTFTWSSVQNGQCISTLSVTNCKFRWRTSSSAAYTEIDCGINMSCTVPANTFTGTSVQWSVAITDNGGTTTSSDWYTLSTAEESSTASINSPKNTMIDGSVANTFSWNHHIGTGTSPTGAELQKSANGTTWTTLATVTGSNTTTTIPANTFTSGQWYWRVRTYNTDGIAGSWSEAASFIAIASPLLQGVTSTQTPRPTVSWQCGDQQGYQVKIGDIDSGIKYGANQSYKCPAYLNDGTYEVKVRTVNLYGLWSEWQTVSCTVSNTPGTAINLTVSHSDAAAELSWSTEGDYSAFIVYRDNVPILKTTNTEYTDNLALGNVTYGVKGVTTGSDNYTPSNEENVTLVVDSMRIADINTFDWIKIDKSSSSASEISMSHKSSSTENHISGADYPIIELSEYKDKILSGKAAFTEKAEANNFTSLNGKCVVVKTQHGDMVVGLLSAIQEVQNSFFYGFSFSVQHTYLIEEVEI